MNQLKEKYIKEGVPALKEKFGFENIHAVPAIEKIVVNAGIGTELRTNSNAPEEVSDMIAQITGQKPIITKSKEAISNFKLRADQPNGVKVTLRKDKMWNFLNKLINITLPRIKDFRGVSANSFDGRGNYSLGIKDHTIFPEIDTTRLSKVRSLQVVISTTAKNNQEGLELLSLLGMPFQKKKSNK